MKTVSNTTFKPLRVGECSICHRTRPLGRVDGDYLACIDCHFGPPMEYWEYCPRCGSLEVNPEAYCYECEQRQQRRADRVGVESVKCGNCGCYRMVTDYIAEACPMCGDEEYDITAVPDAP